MKALAIAGETEAALDIIRIYWGAMLDRGAAAGLIRWICLGFEPQSGLAILALQSMHGLTFAIIHLATIHWLARYERGRAARQGGTAGARAGRWCRRGVVDVRRAARLCGRRSRRGCGRGRLRRGWCGLGLRLRRRP